MCGQARCSQRRPRLGFLTPMSSQFCCTDRRPGGIQRLQYSGSSPLSFVNRCLRRIVGVHWPNTISNADLYERTGQQQMEHQLRRRKWRWIGHTLRKPPGSIARSSLRWNPQGQRTPGRPRITWRREVEAEMRIAGKTWRDLETLSEDRGVWRSFVDGLCSTGS